MFSESGNLLKSVENTSPGIRLLGLIHPQPVNSYFGKPGVITFLAFACFCLVPQIRAQSTEGHTVSQTKRVLLIFSDARNLPGNVLLEESIRTEMTSGSTNQVELYSESIDAGNFPTPRHYQVFRNYIQNKYAGQNLDLVMMLTARGLQLVREFPPVPATNLPSIFVVISDLDAPEWPGGQPFTGIFQRFDVHGTIKFILQLQPETRRVVVVCGTSQADNAVLQRIKQAAAGVEGVTFEYWNDRPIAEVYQAAKTLPPDTVILVGSVQRDVTTETLYTSQVVRNLAPAANVPVYALIEGSIGVGAVGGSVVNLEDIGASAGRMAMRALTGTPVSQIPVEVRSNGVPMVDWRALQRWHISSRRLPANCVIRYQPHSLFEEHWHLFLFIGACLLAQAATIAALLVLRALKQRAEAEILRQRTELAHVSRISTLGQLASALTHELNQPLGAILRNAEAAEIHLQNEQPDLNEVRAILTDIRRDDKRAGNVIDRMRSLFQRQKLTMSPLDLRDLVTDTIAMIRPDADARQVKMKVDIPPQLPAAQGDRVQVQQVLLNLIFNSMDAMNAVPPARRWLAVDIAKTEQGNLQVIVSDRGTGIAPDEAEHIFEPFFTTKANGMGMGLAISKTIIEAHGGEIWMRSNVTVGTTFTFILPPAGSDKVLPGDTPEDEEDDE